MLLTLYTKNCKTSGYPNVCTINLLLFVVLSNKSKIAIFGIGNIAIKLEGHMVYLQNVYYIPDLCIPLFSLYVHCQHPYCEHIADNGEFIITFSNFVVIVDDEEVSHIL